jgi:putative ABC transport system permease protein
VVLISEAAAKKFWPGQDPIGRPIAVGENGFGDRDEIIGVVGDVRYGEMDEPLTPDAYISYLQSPQSSLMIFVRAAGNPTVLIPAIRREVHELNKDLPVYDIQLLPKRMAASTAKARFNATLLAVFALIALALAAIGIYGVMSYVVAQRTHEIGVRMALGAEPGKVCWLMLRRGATLAIAGVVIGILGSLASTRVLVSLLYQVKPGDPSTYAAISAVLGVAAVVAIYVPARRATRVDPMAALRAE